mmetsp:Transcript_11885/g.27868  ORF Transcript_11885/g.27868 Transcript_11885/m.27868 type:complete len:388 (-) Transcript_11885:167-1330(-)
MKKPDFVAKNPTGKVPFLETDMGCVFTSNAVARYVARCRADTSIYGRCFDDEGQIDTWMEFCSHEVEVPLMTWVYPCLGLMKDVPDAIKQAQNDVKGALAVMEMQLASSKYLIGDFVTLADIALVCALREGFTLVFEPAFRKPFPKVCTWFERCCTLPQFAAVFGDVKMCTKAATPKPVSPDKSDKKDQDKKSKAAPQAAAPKAALDKSDKKEKDGKSKAGAAAAAPDPPTSVRASTGPAASAAPPAASAAQGTDVEAQVKAVGDQIRALKEKLKAEGLSNKKINEHAEIKMLVAQLQDLKNQLPDAGGAEPAATPAPVAWPGATEQTPTAAPSGGDLDAQIKAVGDEIRALKEKLKAEGLTSKQVNAHPEVAKLVGQLQELKKAAP